jgi:O-antigen ligase
MLGGGGTSIKVKLVEAESVVNELRKRGSFLNWLAGFGSGAQYNANAKVELSTGLQRYQQVYGVSELTHHVHNFFAAALLRFGVLGAVILVVLLLRIWYDIRKLGIRLSGTSSGTMLRTILAYFIVTLVVMNLFSSFWGDANWGILLALASIQAKAWIIERQNRPMIQYNIAPFEP